MLTITNRITGKSYTARTTDPTTALRRGQRRGLVAKGNTVAVSESDATLYAIGTTLPSGSLNIHAIYTVTGA